MTTQRAPIPAPGARGALILIFAPLLAAAAHGCGPTPADTTTDGDTGTASTAPPEDMSSGTGPDPTGPDVTTTGATTGPDSTGPGTTLVMTLPGTDTGDTDDTGEVCAPPDPNDVVAGWELVLPNGGGIDLDLSTTCTVLAVEKNGLDHQVDFQCTIDGASELLELNYTLAPAAGAAFFVGEEVVLDYVLEIIFHENRWLSIRGAGNPAAPGFSAVSADAFVPDGETAQEFYRLPIAVLEACAPEPDRCGTAQRLALEFEFASQTKSVADGQSASIIDLSGELAIWVAGASKLLEPNGCDDATTTWFRALFIADSGP